MPGKSIDDLGKLQRQAMEIVWRLGEATVHQVRDSLRRRKKPAYTTILSVLQTLEQAGWLRHRKDGKSYVYVPTSNRREAGARSLRRFIDQVFHGDPLIVLQHLVEETELTESEVTKIRRILNQRRKGETR